MATALPKAYRWLADEPGPRILIEALKTFGTVETPGPGNNPAIMAWAKATGLERQYQADETAWCGLWMAYVALQAGWEPPLNPLGARNWLRFGKPVDASPSPAVPAFGDVLVFWRGSRNGWSGHVGIDVGEDEDAYHVLGGNQADAVSIKRIGKDRLLGARRCPWRINQPGNVRVIRLAATGALSTNEA
jgi:uncharacterized protein (TIGR02594 family)